MYLPRYYCYEYCVIGPPRTVLSILGRVEVGSDAFTERERERESENFVGALTLCGTALTLSVCC